MPESPQQWYDRVSAAVDSDGYRVTDLQQWPSWPWTGALTPKPLAPPVPVEPARQGAGGKDCAQCSRSRGDDAADYLVWRDELWMLGLPFGPTALPLMLFLMPRRHVDLQDLTSEEAGRQGELLAAIERAACAVLEVPQIQVARWGDGSEHLHWWLFARPTGQLQLRGTFLSHWDDLLPERSPAALRTDAELVAVALARDFGGEVLRRSSSPGVQ